MSRAPDSLKRDFDWLKIVLGLLGLSVPQVQAWWEVLNEPLPFQIPIWVALWVLIIWGVLGLLLRGTKLWREEDSATPTGSYHDTSLWHDTAAVETDGLTWRVMTPAPPRRVVGRRVYDGSWTKEETLAAMQVEGPFCPSCGQSARQYPLIRPIRVFTCNACGKRFVRLHNRAHMRRVATARGRQAIERLYDETDGPA